MRPRSKQLTLPRYVQFRHGGYYLTKGGKWILLARNLTDALLRYGELVRPTAEGMAGLIDAALAEHASKIAPNTRAQYKLAGEKLKVGLAEFRPEQVQPKDIAGIRRQLKMTPNMANRVLSVAYVVFDYAVEEQLIDSNPVVGVKRCAERARTRLITLDEFWAIRAKAVPRLACAMDLLFLTGQRVNDVLTLKLASLREDGIHFRQQKTDAKLVVGWTPELRATVDEAKRLIRGVSGFTLLQGRHGKAVDYRSMVGSWHAACTAAGVEDAQLRDIRAMAATAIRAQGGNATALLGHKSKAMTERYLRDKAVPVVSGPSFVVPLKRKDCL